MKRMQSLVSSLVVCGIALAMVSTLTAESAIQENAKVERIKGSARYKIGSGAWQTLKRGDRLKEGTVIETGADSRVDLVMGTSETPAPRPIVGEVQTYQPTAEQNMVRIWENSRLAIDKFVSTTTGADVVTDTKLDLQAGHIFGSVKKMTAASKYEVKIPSGVAAIRGTVYDMSVEGVIKVLRGSIYLSFIDAAGNSKTQSVMSQQQFDVRTGVLQPLSNPDKEGMPKIASQLLAIITSPMATTFSSDQTLQNVPSTYAPK
ncbi:MAG: FecR domain-containing protein [Verrucomicrobiota bacterium]|nr:FecR domain-containing protein [Verrucomicrobiota bacterium]